jgi:DNA-binding response OmpR family regulator
MYRDFIAHHPPCPRRSGRIVLGLDLGAEDYLTKPFRLREMISRMKAVLRRRAPAGASDRTLTCGDVTMVTQQAKLKFIIRITAIDKTASMYYYIAVVSST